MEVQKGWGVRLTNIPQGLDVLIRIDEEKKELRVEFEERIVERKENRREGEVVKRFAIFVGGWVTSSGAALRDGGLREEDRLIYDFVWVHQVLYRRKTSASHAVLNDCRRSTSVTRSLRYWLQ
ncbi:hypothetical protein R1flu_022806 [Riccia fluitans]|uniref:Ubiquitin-like domain-containing protein n=1 Tax=Riccia fluitans TaxID=41844 RepID=A0ABD1XQR0_9MARC